VAKVQTVSTGGSTPAPIRLITHDPIPEGLSQEEADARFYLLDAEATRASKEQGSESETYAMAWYEVHHHVKAYGTPEDYECPEPEGPVLCNMEGCQVEVERLYCDQHWPICFVKGCTEEASPYNLLRCRTHLDREYVKEEWNREARLAQAEGRLNHPAQSWLPYYIRD
jgi:hypothetical protein